jgi:D-proline reductase (dithiol) PrdB
MTVDSFAFLPRAFVPLFEATPVSTDPPAWTPFEPPLAEATIGLVTSAGVHLTSQVPFDLDRERAEPSWGDPTLRVLPVDLEQAQVAAAHLHIDTGDVLADVNVALPVHRLAELAAAGVVGAAAPEHYSVMGYQAEGLEAWRTETGPEIVARCHAADIDALILAPA